MASTAISAQGSTFAIGTATGSAKNVTGLTLGNPTIVQSTAHGFSNGDVVTFAALTGNTTLNGKTLVVKNVTTNTFAVDVDTTGGSAWASGGTITPVTWTTIANIRDFTAFDGSAAVIDVTNLLSTSKEKRMGLQDNGNFSFNMDQDNSDAGQLALRASRTAQSLKQYKLTLPNANTATFSAYCSKVSDAGSVDGVVKNAVTLIISGDVIRA
jgi:hypothetical protein